MPAEKQIRILHAGFHKTGSSYLQYYIFPNLQGVTFVHRLDLGRVPILDRNEKQTILFSSEASCGYPIPVTPAFSPDRLISNVRLLCIDKVILVSRNFEGWVLSLWFQTLNEGHAWSLKSFLDKNLAALRSWERAPEILRCELEAEGVEFVCIDHEDLLKRPDEALRMLCDYIGGELPEEVTQSKANASRWGRVTIATYRLLNALNKNIAARAVFRALALTPRKMIQGSRSPLAKITELISMSTWSANDVRRLIS